MDPAAPKPPGAEGRGHCICSTPWTALHESLKPLANKFRGGGGGRTMTAQSPEPGAEIPGGRSPGELEQLRERLHACMPIVNAIDDVIRDETSHAYVVYVFTIYRYFALGEEDEDYVADFIADIIDMNKNEIEKRVKTFSELQARSIENVIKACNVKQKLFDLAPSLRMDINAWKNVVKRKGHKDVLGLLKKLETMSVEEFFAKWKDIIDKLEEYGYDELVDRINKTIDYESRFTSTVINEITELSAKLLDLDEERIEKLIMCFLAC